VALTVVGGMPVGSDGRIHTTFGHNPSSLRLCSFDPNLQNIPRGSSEVEKWVKDIFVAGEGHTFWERDFSGIEAVLVGYFAGAKNYVRLAKTDVHSFYTAYALNALDGRVSANDLPDLSWDDNRLRARLADIKKEFKADRNNLYKHLVHGANYLQTPVGAQAHIFKSTGRAFDVALIRKVMGVYFELFPEIGQWHRDLCNRVDGTKRRETDGTDAPDPWTLGVCYARNPFGYVHHFYNVLDWEKIDGKWYSSFGEDAKRLVSFLPQSTAAAIIKSAAKRIWNEYPWVGLSLRLLIHDSILGEAPDGDIETCLRISQDVMETPIPELPLDPAWNMGTYLSIGTEAKVGRVWSEMN
jgi:hypothetical protein